LLGEQRWLGFSFLTPALIQNIPQIYREIESSDAMVLVLTDHWLASKWCFAEFRLGRALGKKIFPIIMTEIVSPGDFAPDIQKLDLTNSESGLPRLSKQLNGLPRPRPSMPPRRVLSKVRR